MLTPKGLNPLDIRVLDFETQKDSGTWSSGLEPVLIAPGKSSGKWTFLQNS